MTIRVIPSLLLIATLWVASMPCSAGDTANLFGRYTYETYLFKWPTGQSTGFKELGASGATLEISCDMSITLTMHMLSGADHVSQAQILELHLEGDAGHLIAKWPEMTYAIRKDFTLHEDTLRYVILFNEPRDAFRYRGHDQGVLRRISDNDSALAASTKAPCT